MKFFRCDKCKVTSQAELEQMSWKYDGQDRVIDLCPTYRDAVKAEIATLRKNILNAIYNAK